MRSPSEYIDNLSFFSEIDRLSNGEHERKEAMLNIPHKDLHLNKPQKFNMKIRLPVREYPRVCFKRFMYINVTKHIGGLTPSVLFEIKF